jgi:hypothetical protein
MAETVWLVVWLGAEHRDYLVVDEARGSTPVSADAHWVLRHAGHTAPGVYRLTWPPGPEDAPAAVERVGDLPRLPPPMCQAECTAPATHGPAGVAIVCWGHAGDWPEVSR